MKKEERIFLENEFLELPETTRIKDLFNRASQGILIRGTETLGIVKKLIQLTRVSE